MKPNYGFLRVARLELREAMEWYDAEREGLGAELWAAVEKAIEKIRSSPESWPRVSTKSRKYRLDRFPYAIIYQFREGMIAIIGVVHLHRRPMYWRDRELD